MQAEIARKPAHMYACTRTCGLGVCVFPSLQHTSSVNRYVSELGGGVGIGGGIFSTYPK